MEVKIYFISDLHFFHRAIIDYCNRPFSDTDEMAQTIIKNWNKVVKKNDIVWVLGDIAMCSKSKFDNLKSLVAALNGDKRLIMGNHDNFKVKDYYELGFNYVSKYPVLWQGKYLLSHEPQPTAEYKNIFGHVHNCEYVPTYTSNSACVCIERHNYAPVAFEDLVEGMKAAKGSIIEVLKDIEGKDVKF